MEKLKVYLIVKFKDGKEKEIFFDTIENIIVDYENNKFSVFDYSIGYWYHYHFRYIDDCPVVKEFKVIKGE